jgi:hypothetical protein
VVVGVALCRWRAVTVTIVAAVVTLPGIALIPPIPTLVGVVEVGVAVARVPLLLGLARRTSSYSPVTRPVQLL